MIKCLAVMAGTLAILAIALLPPAGPAAAGASASAPSKYAHNSRATNGSGYPISEYSSSARRTNHRQ